MTLPLDVEGATTRSARFSPDRRYRYTLRRHRVPADAPLLPWTPAGG